MPFFIHPQAYHPQPTFNPLLELLREVNKDSCQPRQRPVRTFTPKFDIAEDATSYQLYGELPGIEQKNIKIEFTDRQTLTISGHRERQAPSNTPAATETPAHDAEKESLKATVEDDFEEVSAADSDSASTAQNTEATAAPVQEKPAEEPKPRFWVAERGVGQFSRSFEFQEGIDQQGVRASLTNGVLSIVVPKKPFESRKIEIN